MKRERSTHTRVYESDKKRLNELINKHGFSGTPALIRAMLNQVTYLKLFLKSEGSVI